MGISVTALYAALTGLLAIALGLRVVVLRRRHGVGVGSGGHNDLSLAIRAHGNLLEQAPIALLLLLLLELSGARSGFLHAIGGLFVVARLLHAWGLSGKPGYSFGRFYGTAITWGMVIVTSVALLVKLFIR
ncbi:MAG: MAPEG family protein [Gammaproteobacteria bacterium]|nr:MAPEG family protein [Gammaproteobacteria bacterium]